MENELANQEPTAPSEVAYGTMMLFKEATITALLEDYCCFLKKHGKCDSAASCNELVDKIFDVAIPRGDCSEATRGHIRAHIEKHIGVMSAYTKSKLRRERMFLHVVQDELPELIATFANSVPEDLAATVGQLAAAKATAAGIAEELRGANVELFDKILSQFFVDYSQLLDPEFVERLTVSE